MQIRSLSLRGIIFLVAFCIVYLFVYSATVYNVNAQPPTMTKYTDDLELCRGVNTTDTSNLAVGIRQFCSIAKSSDPNIDKTTRDDLIELVRGQIDEYYKDHKNGKREKNKWFQTILDILEVGAATTIDFIKGERAKTVIASALIGLKGGRTAFNRNFEVLQLQVLVNKMNADRAIVHARIVRNKAKGVGKYRWLEAKNDLRDYLVAGTFGNAMDSLVKTTSNEVTVAEVDLQQAKINAGITLAPTAAHYKAAMEIDALLYEVESAWEDAEAKRVAAVADIATADLKIGEANNAIPQDTVKRDTWTANKAAAVFKNNTATEIQTKAFERVKRIYKASNDDPEVKALLQKVPIKYAAFKANIEASLARITSATATITDYLSLLQKLNGVTLAEFTTNPSVVERVKNLLEGSK